MRSVEFAFWIRDRVVTPLGADGIVTTAGVDDGEKKMYWVTTATHQGWWPEDQLKKKEGA